MTNQVFIDGDGFIRNLHVGDQTKESVSAMIDQLVTAARQLRAKHQPVLALIDLSRLGKHDTGARRIAADGIRTLDYDRAAAFGGSELTRHTVNLIVRASGRGDRFKYFRTEPEALAFLKAKA